MNELNRGAKMAPVRVAQPQSHELNTFDGNQNEQKK